MEVCQDVALAYEATESRGCTTVVVREFGADEEFGGNLPLTLAAFVLLKPAGVHLIFHTHRLRTKDDVTRVLGSSSELKRVARELMKSEGRVPLRTVARQ